MKRYFILEEQLRLTGGTVVHPGTILFQLTDFKENKYSYTFETTGPNPLTVNCGEYYPRMTKLPDISTLDELSLARLLFS